MSEIKPEYLTEKQVAVMTGFSLSKLRNDRFLCRGLPYYKIGKCVRYGYEEIISYIEANRIVANYAS